MVGWLTQTSVPVLMGISLGSHETLLSFRVSEFHHFKIGNIFMYTKNLKT